MAPDKERNLCGSQHPLPPVIGALGNFISLTSVLNAERVTGELDHCLGLLLLFCHLCGLSTNDFQLIGVFLSRKKSLSSNQMQSPTLDKRNTGTPTLVPRTLGPGGGSDQCKTQLYKTHDLLWNPREIRRQLAGMAGETITHDAQGR